MWAKISLPPDGLLYMHVCVSASVRRSDHQLPFSFSFSGFYFFWWSLVGGWWVTRPAGALVVAVRHPSLI
jgi:hypothetical protein